MKIDWNTKYNTISVYVILTACAIILFFLGTSQLDDLFENISRIFTIMQPFIVGFFIAYILNFILKFFENIILETNWAKKLNLKQITKRRISMILTYACTILFIYIFLKFVLPQLISSLNGLLEALPDYINMSINHITKAVDNLLLKLNIEQEYLKLINENLNKLVNYGLEFAKNILPWVYDFLSDLALKLWNVVLGLIVSIYILYDKEHFIGLTKKIVYAVFPENGAKKLIYIGKISNDTFGKFLVGKLLDSLIIGILAFIVLKICDMPYSLLISVIIGITNIIPFFGPFIGAIPSFLIILFESPTKAFWFLIIVLIIQQLDGNVIGPKILGESIGISAFWILFAILVAGKLLGLLGMIIGVPLFAVIYMIIKELVEDKLRSKNLKTETKDYQ